MVRGPSSAAAWGWAGRYRELDVPPDLADRPWRNVHKQHIYLRALRSLPPSVEAVMLVDGYDTYVNCTPERAVAAFVDAAKSA